MPPRDPEFGPDVGGDLLTIPCYLAKGYDDPGFLKWRQDHPDWFVAGTWTSQLKKNGATQVRSNLARDANAVAAQPPTTSGDRHERSPATRPTAGRGRTFPPLDPSTISLADFHDVADQAKRQRVVSNNAAKEEPERRQPFLEAERAVLRPSRPLPSMDVDPKLESHQSVHTVAHTNPEGGVPLILNDGTPVLERSGKPMLVPPGVDLNRNIDGGRFLSHEPMLERLATLGAILRPGGRMDYQRTFGSGQGDPLFNDINRSYVAFGNFNYGAMTAAAGLSLENAEYFAGMANMVGGDRSGPFGTNPATLPYIIQGYEAVQSGLVGRK